MEADMKKKVFAAACLALMMARAVFAVGLVLLASVTSFSCTAVSGAERAGAPVGQGSAANRPGLASAKIAEEALLDRFSPVKAAEFLDAHRHVDEKSCLTCHGTYSYLLVKPLVASRRKPHREARLALEKDVVKQASLGAQPTMAGMPVVYAVVGAATLAQLDAATGKLQPLTREALDRMWKLQRDDGHWEWEKQNEVPSAIDDHFGATMAAIAAGAAPENYADTPQARKGVAKLRDYFRNHPPQNLHHRALLLLASHYLRGLMTEADRRQTLADLWALQRPDGGWPMCALGNWKRKDGKPQNLVASDGYGTGLATYVLRTAGGIAADDARLRKAVAWLKTHQRASGGWYTYSPTKNDELSSYTGTVYALLALDACGEIQRPAAPDREASGTLESLRAAVASLRASFPDQYPGDAFLRRLDELAGRQADPSPSGAWRDELKRLHREMLVHANPLLKSKRLLFVKRNAYGSVHYYDDHDNGIVNAGMGGNLCVLSLNDGSVRELAPQLAGGLFDRYDLSFDGQRIVFGYCQAVDDALRLWRIDTDGSNLRQLTFPPSGETAAARAALSPSWRKPAGPMARDPQGNLSSRRFLTQDFHPCWLPDGGIVFASTRAQHTVLCGDIGLSVPNLYRLEPDGCGLRRLSHGTLNELCPTVLNDGRILYNRWEYIFKSLFLVQPLWAMYPDGSRSEAIYGNNSGQPGVFTQGRAVPGRDDLIVCVGACHEQMAVGPILLVDLKRDKRSADAMHSLTPEVEARGQHDRWFLRDSKMVRDSGTGGPVFCDPWPLSDKFFLVAHNPDQPIPHKAGYGLYLLDVFGNRVPIYRDPAISCWQPMLLQPRTKPPVLPTTVARVDDTRQTPPAGTLMVQNVYEGLHGVRPRSVKYLRVVEQVPRSWDVLQKAAPEDGGCGSPVVIMNLNTHIWVAVLHGLVPVQEDGSAYFTVPAERNIFLQALDENYMQVQTMRTFVNLQPGETRSCIGCHEDRRHTPGSRAVAPVALRRPAVRPVAQPGDATASRPLHYAADVQPVLDQHCVRCHSGAAPAGQLNLTAEPTQFFTRSYEELIGKGYVRGFNEWTAEPKDTAPVPPYSRGSPMSRLIEGLRQGRCGVTLSQAELVKLVTWVDLNLPYYGSYFGRRNLRYKDEPDFRPVPTPDSARVSTDDQDLSLQIGASEKHGVAKSLLFMDKLSGARSDRPGLRCR